MNQIDTAAATPRVLLLDDHALLRRGMRDALRDEGVRVVGEAASWDELQPLLRNAPADVLVLDGNVPGPGGLDVLEAIKAQPSPPRTLVMSMGADAAYAAQAARGGAAGYLSKSCDIATLTDAIRTVAQGRQYIAPAVACPGGDAQAAPTQQHFSEREQQLLALLASGRRLPDIAERLELAPKAVSVYRARLLEKMKLSSNAELAHWAVRHNLVGAAA
jgi:two-component system, NarL family, invasion response regulator UvrY